MILIGVIALVMLVALASYHRDDPAFSSTGGAPSSFEDGAVGNKIGPFGAWLSDILFFLFGRPAYLFPLMLGVACFVMFRQRDDEEGRTRANTAVRIGGFTLMLFASCGLATLHWSAGVLRETRGRRGRAVHRQRARREPQFPRCHAVHAGRLDGRRVAGIRCVLVDHRRSDRSRTLEWRGLGACAPQRGA